MRCVTQPTITGVVFRSKIWAPMAFEFVLMVSSLQHLCVLYYGNNVLSWATLLPPLSQFHPFSWLTRLGTETQVSWFPRGGGVTRNSSAVWGDGAGCFRWPDLLLVTRKTGAAHSSETSIQSFLWTRFKNLRRPLSDVEEQPLAVGEFMAATSGMWNQVYMIDGERVTEIQMYCRIASPRLYLAIGIK